MSECSKVVRPGSCTCEDSTGSDQQQRPLSLDLGKRLCTNHSDMKCFFLEIIDYLYETSLPLLKEKLEKKMEKTGIEIQTPAAPKRVFLFRDIFYSDNDSEGEDGNERS